jgi:hypothetical protein
LLGISIILLCLPVDFVVGVWLVNHIWHPAIIGGAQTQAHLAAPPTPEWQVAIGFIFWLDFGFVGAYGFRLSAVASVIWVFLLIFGNGVGTKTASFVFLAPSVIFVLAKALVLR